MNIIIKIFIFFIVLLLYLHINDFLNVNNSLIINELYYVNKLNYEKICKLKNPLLIYDLHLDVSNILNHIKDKNIYLEIDGKDTLNYNEFIELLDTDNCGNLMSINNNINDDTVLLDYFKNSDFNIRPVNNLFNNYDIIIGNDKSSSFYEYNLHYRNILSIVSGSIDLILIPPKYLDNFNFSLDVNNFKYKTLIFLDELKIKKIPYKRVTLKKGDMIYIPYKWLYNIIFKEKTHIFNYSYVNSINFACNMHYYLLKNIKNRLLMK